MLSLRAHSGSPEQMAGATAAALVQASAHHAFELFKDKEFRRSAGFAALTQAEQDRIFNELIVSCIVLIILVLGAPDLRVPPEFRDYLAKLKEIIPKLNPRLRRGELQKLCYSI